jgi:hypothetical protein
VNGNNYDESNPVGTELLVGGSSDGQDSLVYVDLTFIANYFNEELYMGCSGDGYSVNVNGRVYDESNPTGTETIANGGSCDSIINIKLDFSREFQMAPEIFNVCNGIFTDTGGSGEYYLNNEDITTTLCSDNGGAILVEFTSFDVEITFDFPYIYDGTDTNASLLGT